MVCYAHDGWLVEPLAHDLSSEGSWARVRTADAFVDLSEEFEAF
jgi:hypothetical protein